MCEIRAARRLGDRVYLCAEFPESGNPATSASRSRQTSLENSPTIAGIAVAAAEFLGISTTFVRVVGLLERLVAPGHVGGNAYFEKTGLVIDWQSMLVVGVFLGALV
jgi:hypothetical protein